jgi:predicted site-specific integrase-resolvase
VIESWTHQEIGRRSTPVPATIRGAEYVRMSTEHQKYSTENQADAIRQYAGRRGIEIVRTYADEGKSGLRLDGRDALKQLINDVQDGTADFDTILVYDVSRAGITVQYCAEQFENDGSPVSTIVKGVKRAMARVCRCTRSRRAASFPQRCSLASAV